MQFYSGHPMADRFHTEESDNYSENFGKEQDLGVGNIGMSVPMGISASNVSGIYLKIRMGAGNLELGFPGVFTGNRNAHTPGMYGEDQRQAIREIAEINEVKLTTHSAYGIMGMMGQDQRGNFSVSGSADNVREIQRAIDFAADTAGGGSVVIHSGEFDRPFTDMFLDDETHGRKHNLSREGGKGRMLFMQKHGAEGDAGFILLDDRTSQKLETVQKDRFVAYPVWLTSKEDQWGVDTEGNRVRIRQGDYIDYQGRKIKDQDIYDPTKGRVPEYDQATKRFRVKTQDFDYFKGEADRYNEWLMKNWKYKYPEMSEQQFKDKWYYLKKYPEEAYLHATLETNEGHSRGWALQYGADTQEHQKAIEKLKETRGYYEKLKENMPKDELWKIFKQDSRLTQRFGPDMVPPESVDPVDYINQLIKSEETRLEFSRQASTSQEQQAADTAETKEHIVTPIKRLEKHGAVLYAIAATRALQKTKDPNNPLVLTIENLFPDKFGGHPEELMWLVKKTREKFAEIITSEKHWIGGSEKEIPYKELGQGKNPYYVPGVSKEEATKLAEKHIKVTLDTGHLNLWRKYYQHDPYKTLEQNDQEFNKWYLNQVEKLAKGKFIGNVHLTDNYGFQDDHISPGQGNVPIKETIKILRKYGYDKAITVEPGADASTDLSDFHGLMKTWRYLGSPIYGMGGGGGSAMGGFRPTFGQVQYSYFGQNQPPNYTFGSYAPSNDWTLWSQVPLE
ncbi:MAG: sugar phosphate isomerase/epimerase [Nanoarchaeota archaeon]|nr:sugar phosphate isomerase/epimerase [Nanoarchaeota archaeon]